MTVRIGWDEYEVALLIDACNRIRDNKIDKAECVHKLSNLLRQRAKANGINIDEVFRNENGIALQMTKMEYLLTDGKKGLPGASKLYIEMAKMSKSRVLTLGAKEYAIIKIYVGIRSNNISIKLDGNYYNAEETAESYIYSVELKNYSKKGKFSIDILDGGSVLASGQQFEIEKKGMSQNNMFDF